MANRKARRASEKVMKRPEMKAYAENFAMEISNILMAQFEESKQHTEKTGEAFKVNLDDKFKEIMETKGKELYDIARGNKDPKVMVNKTMDKIQNKNKAKVKISSYSS